MDVLKICQAREENEPPFSHRHHCNPTFTYIHLPPNELSDPLLAAAGMKADERANADAPHVTVAHGDPLLKEAEHSHKLALHSELHGQGDPLLDAALEKIPTTAKDALMGTGHSPDHQRLGAGEKHVPKFNDGEGGGGKAKPQ